MTSTAHSDTGNACSPGKAAVLLTFLALALPWPVAAVNEDGAGPVQIHGELRAMMHQGQTGQMVKLDTLLPDANLYGLGALTDLAGEITIINGMAYMTFADGEHDIRSEASTEPDGSATLLATGRVSSWVDVTVTEDILFADLDAQVATLAAAAGNL